MVIHVVIVFQTYRQQYDPLAVSEPEFNQWRAAAGVLELDTLHTLSEAKYFFQFRWGGELHILT